MISGGMFRASETAREAHNLAHVPSGAATLSQRPTLQVVKLEANLPPLDGHSGHSADRDWRELEEKL
jgi:hypothetical protein